MISVQKLVKRYGSGPRGRLAVDDVSFEVDKGEVVGFLGPNGAGKSTTLRILSGFLGMTSGKVSVAGHDIREQSFEAARTGGEIMVHVQKGFTTTRMQMMVSASTGTSLKNRNQTWVLIELPPANSASSMPHQTW